MKNNESGAIVLGGHVQALGIIRALGRKGIPAITVDNTSLNLAKHSCYSTDFHLVNDESLLSFLFELKKNSRYKNWTIFPTNDFHVKILSQNKNLLEPHFLLAIDSWNSISVFYNKTRSYKLAESIGIPIPNTFYPKDINELDTLATSFPCIIKPAVMHDFYKQSKRKVFLCNSLFELKANYQKALMLIPSDEVIIQEIIPGSGRNQFSACFLFLNGQTFLHLTACRLRQHPIDFGNATTYAETVDLPIIKKYAEKILNAAGYNGLCEVEFKLDDRDKTYKFLEVNTRTWKWHSISQKAGIPFLFNYFNYLNGIDIEPVKSFKHASFFHFVTDFPIRSILLFKKNAEWKRFRCPIVHAVWAWDDIKPWFFEKIYLPFFFLKR